MTVFASEEVIETALCRPTDVLDGVRTESDGVTPAACWIAGHKVARSPPRQGAQRRRAGGGRIHRQDQAGLFDV